MADMSDILNVLTSIENYLVDLPTKILLKADQIYIVNGLSDVSENLGIITAGEFRAGNRLDPGKLFTGMRMAYPAMTYDLDGTDTLFHLVGVNADVLQFGVNAENGTLVAGAGAVVLSATGIAATAGSIAGWTINSNYLGSDGTPGIKILSTGAIETSDFVSGILGKGWRISEAGDAEFNNAIIRGELRTTVLSYQEVQAVSGTMGVFQSAGVILETTGVVPAIASSLNIKVKDPEYGHVALFAVNDVIWIKDGTNATWFTITSVTDNTTYYTYACRVESGSTGNVYTAGQAIVNFGITGEGHLLMEAIGTGAPYFSVRTTSATPWTGSNIEHVRMGNLNGNWGYATNIYGAAIGNYTTGVGNITIDPTNGVRIRVYDTTVMEFKSTGSFITNILNMSGANAAIAIGATPPTSSSTGTGIWLSKDGLYALLSDVQEITLSAGVLKFGYRVIDEAFPVPEQAKHWSQLNNNGVQFDLVYNPNSYGTKQATPAGNKIWWWDEYNSNISCYFEITADTYGEYTEYLVANLDVRDAVTGQDEGVGLNLSVKAGSGETSTIGLYSGLLGDKITLTSPQILAYNGLLDPWSELNTTTFSIAYSSSTAIRVYTASYGDMSSWFPIGTKIKITQTSGTKYFYVLAASYSSPNVTLTVTGVGTYTVANETILKFYYSHSAEAYIPIGSSTFIPLTTPLTSTSWDGDSFSTTAKTLIDLSAVFGVPAGVKAVLIRIQAWDSGSASATSNWFGVSPNNTASSLTVVARCAGLPNNSRGDQTGWCPCNTDGDIYYQNSATGTSTMGVDIQIWGYAI